MRPSILIGTAAATLLATAIGTAFKSQPGSVAAAPAASIERPLNQMKAAVACGTREKQCRMGGYVLWCCRADQACSGVAAGVCY